MVTVQKFPIEDLKYVIFHKSIWPVIWGDMAPDPETIDFEKALKDPNFQFWLVYFDDRPVGYHCAGNENNIYWKVQTGFLPEARGKGALLSAKVAIFELFNKYHAKKLVAEIAEDNLPSQQFIKLCGFKEEGLNSKAFMRNGVLLDLIRYAKWG